MATNYLDITKNEEFIYLDPIPHGSKNEDEVAEGLSSASKKFNTDNALSNLFQMSIEQKINNQNTHHKFQVLQKWEGVVEQFDGEIIHVKLTDLTNGGNDEEAELDIYDISRDDLALVKEGAMFYWSIGYETQLDRQVKKSSFIKFKRLPKINPDQFDLIHDRAIELKNNLLLD